MAFARCLGTGWPTREVDRSHGTMAIAEVEAGVIAHAIEETAEGVREAVAKLRKLTGRR